MDIPNITKHYVDFVRCEDAVTVDTVKKCMEQQWSALVTPRGWKVKVKVKEEEVSAIVEKSFFIICKLSFDCRYFNATAKAVVRLSDSSSPRECQFRDLILCSVPPFPIAPLVNNNNIVH